MVLYETSICLNISLDITQVTSFINEVTEKWHLNIEYSSNYS